jgi:uncharacterized protein (DUF302 family)
MTEYGYQVEISEGYDEAVTRTRLALRAEGFSVITEMHVGGMLGADAGTGRQYLIMGAWDADTSNTSDTGLRVALQIPCNVVVHESENRTIVAVLDPEEGTDSVEENVAVAAADARNALHRVLEKVSAPV